MSTQVQRRKGTTAQHASFTGASAELTVDTTKNTVVVHDGATAGGIPLAKETGSAISAASLTLPNGTANAVAFLNGSKVLTSGTALTFDGAAALTITGAGSSGNGAGPAFGVSSNSTADQYYMRLNSAKQLTFYGYDQSNSANGWSSLALADGGKWVFYAANAEAMRLTSTGLGIGTSSPSAKLEVAGSIKGTGTAATAINGLFLTGTTTQWNRVLVENTSGSLMLGTDGSTPVWGGAAYAGVVGTNGSTPLQFMTTGQLRATLDASGNLGLGVTPSAWTRGKNIEMGWAGNAVMSPTNASTALSQNAYFATSWKYGQSSVATALYEIGSGGHTWYNAPSGTAGAAITFTQAMTLDASGNLLVGTTSGNSRLNLKGPVDTYALATFNQDTAANNAYAQISFQKVGSVVGSITSLTSGTAYNTTSDYRLKNITGPITTSGAYIDSLKPVEGTWKADGSTFVGLIAHETQEASRTTVATGTKDGDEMQGMDYSSAEIIANLIAELQSLRARVAQLESK